MQLEHELQVQHEILKELGTHTWLVSQPDIVWLYILTPLWALATRSQQVTYINLALFM